MSKNSENIKQSTAAQKEFNALTQEGKASYREFQGIFEAINEELGQQVNSANKAKKEYNALLGISRSLFDNQEDINTLTDKQLDKQLSLAKSSVAEIKRITEKIQLNKTLTEEEKALVAAKGEGFALENGLVTKIEDEIGLRKESNKLMGVAGGLLSSLNAIAGPFAKALKLDQVEKDMKKVADRVAESKEGFGKLKVLAAGAGSAISNAFSTLTDPGVILAAIGSQFLKIGKAQREFRKVTGQNASTFRNINSSLTSTTQLIGAATALSKELSVNASVVFTNDTITEVAELTEFMGMGAHEAAQLAKFAKLSGQELSTVTKGIESSFKAFVATNRVGLNFSDVMNDVGSVSAEVSLSLGSNPAKITAAAMEARKLGLSLQQVDDIAGSLLDFEQSISNEMQAELITGKELNLDKARQLALNNDLEGVAKEIGKNAGILKAFAGGNRIAQEATAKALGMSRQDMAKMIYSQKIASGLTAKQAADAADISLKEAKRLSAQESIALALEKVAQAAANVLNIFTPILGNTVVLGATLLSIVAIVGVKLFNGFRSSVKEMKSLGKEALKFLKTTGLIEKAKGLFSVKPKQSGIPFMSAMNKAVPTGPIGPINKAGGAIGGVADSTKGIKKGSGEIIKGFLTGIGDGLAALGNAMKSLGPTGLGYLAAGMAIFTLSIMGLGAALGFAAPGIKAFGTVITSIFGGVATVITAVADGLVKIMNAVTMDNIKPLLLLGAAFVGISAGLGLMAVAGLGALPILGAIGALALVAAPLLGLATLFGGGGGDDEGDGNSEIIKKLDEIITLIAAGGDVLIDGNKAGQLINLAGSGMGR